jgi:hypothetical protein
MRNLILVLCLLNSIYSFSQNEDKDSFRLIDTTNKNILMDNELDDPSHPKIKFVSCNENIDGFYCFKTTINTNIICDRIDTVSSPRKTNRYLNTTIESKKNEYVFICTADKLSACCKEVILRTSFPETGKCCTRSDGNGCKYGHSWSFCGKYGKRVFRCYDCGITVRTQRRPKNSCCPVNGCNKKHRWEEYK